MEWWEKEGRCPWSGERQRRSRIDWYSIVPANVAKEQVCWERHKTASALHEAGHTFQQIGNFFGVTRDAASYMTRVSEAKTEAPVDIFFRQQGLALPPKTVFRNGSRVLEEVCGKVGIDKKPRSLRFEVFRLERVSV